MLVGVVLLPAIFATCASPPDSKAGAAESDPPPRGGGLWIAVAYREGDLVPVARYADGVWDSPPWSGEVLEDIEDLDTLGRSADVIVASLPASWSLFSPAHQGLLLKTVSVRLATNQCSLHWVIVTDRDSLPGFGEERISFREVSGVALSLAPSAVLSEGDLPDVEKLRKDLGFVDVPPGGDGVRSFRWLGFFRAEGKTFGVLRGLYYEGSDYRVIQIDGDRGRVVVRTYEGGC